jgi:cellulose synthase/poly-beta-1,6-N-acetylglucosamine synthase-like glycosyltransferase
VVEPAPGRSRARNAGVAAAHGRLIAFTDADCVVSPGWLEGFSECAGSAPLLAGPVRVTTGKPPNAVERFEQVWRFQQEAWVNGLGWAATANLLVDRGAFEAVGGFDTAYRHTGEDVDFCTRARGRGLRLGFCAAAEVTHDGESRLWPLLKRSFWHGYGGVQASRRVGVGYSAWRHPRPLLVGEAAAERVGLQRSHAAGRDWRALSRLARVSYGMRMLGSAWAEARGVR